MKKAAKKVTFHDVVQVTTAINYSRKTKRDWMNLSTVDKIKIRLELNKFKMTEMTVHPQRNSDELITHDYVKLSQSNITE